MIAPLLLTLLGATPVIDGAVDLAEWKDAIVLEGFTQEFPDEGAKPLHATTVHLAFDEKTLYLAFELDDEPGHTTARLARRDEGTGDDSVSLDIDCRGDAQRAFHFELGAAGVQRDAIRTGDGALDFAWDAVWLSAVKLLSRGWSAELAIPLTALRFEEGSEGRWRFQFGRFVSTSNESDTWVHMPRADHGEMQRYRGIPGLPRFTPPRGVELRPFVLGRLRREAPVDSPATWAPFASVGLDARVALTSGLSLDATVLPDFGQVEADQALLNLTTFELGRAEKRPFFLEGADLFALKDASGNPLGVQLFYSRRLGAPVPPGEVPAGHTLVAAPEVARIWGAAKVSGRLGEDWSVALLDGVVAAEEATLLDETGAARSRPLVPASNFLVARFSRAAFAGLTLGAMATDVRRLELPMSLEFAERCPNGNDSVPPDWRCTHDATSAALDATWTSESGEYAAAGTLVGSVLQGGPARTLRDGTVLTPGKPGYGGRLEFTKAAGRLGIEALFESASPTLDLNDAGFLQTQNLHRLFLRVGWRVLDTGPTKDFRVAVEAFGRNAWDGVPIARGLQLNSYTQFRNFWHVWWELQWYPTTFDNRETSDGARYERPQLWGAVWWLSTNGTAPVVFSMDGSVSTTWRGTDFEPNLSLTVRAGSAFEVTLSPSLVRVTGDPRWVDTFGTTAGTADYRFGLQDALAAGATLRVAWTLSPRASFSVYGQLFASQVHYPALFQQTGAGEHPWLTLEGLAPLDADGSSYDSRDVALNTTALFRWEYLPGSVLSLVYSHGQAGAPVGQSPSGIPRLNLAALGRVPAQDVVLAKLTYYWSR